MQLYFFLVVQYSCSCQLEKLFAISAAVMKILRDKAHGKYMAFFTSKNRCKNYISQHSLESRVVCRHCLLGSYVRIAPRDARIEF